MDTTRELVAYFLITSLVISTVIIIPMELMTKYHYKPLAKKQVIIDHYREFRKSLPEISDYYKGFEFKQTQAYKDLIKQSTDFNKEHLAIYKEMPVIPEEPLPNAIDENNLVEEDYDTPLEEDTEVESTNEDNKVIAEGVINKRPSRGKKGLVDTIDVLSQEVKILEQLLKDSNKRMSNLKKALLEFRRELRASKIKG